jgi:voltage-gated potassium channel
MDLRFRPTGIGATAALVSAVAVLSVATGLVNISTPTAGPLALYVPMGIQQAAGFTGTITGFVMLVTAASMRRGLRVAWLSAVVLLPVTAIQGLVQSSAFSIPLVVLSVAATVVTWWNRARFDREVALSTSQIAAGLALVGAQLYGTLGTFALRDEFPGVDSIADAFYFTVVTASTVGYGDITPSSTIGELFALSVLVVGVTSFTAALGALFAPLLEARFATALGRMNESALELLEYHVVVLGYGDLTEPILTELADAGVDYVVVAKPDNASIPELQERDVPLVTADPSDEEPLERVHIDRARAVVAATNDDAPDALAILTARELRPDVTIVAAATDRENVDKLKRAGADTVISPAQIGGHLLVESALGSTDSERIADSLVEGHLDEDAPESDALDED